MGDNSLFVSSFVSAIDDRLCCHRPQDAFAIVKSRLRGGSDDFVDLLQFEEFEEVRRCPIAAPTSLFTVCQ